MSPSHLIQLRCISSLPECAPQIRQVSSEIEKWLLRAFRDNEFHRDGIGLALQIQRTLQRRFKPWRVRSGPTREVIFPQAYEPGRQCQSNFTYMGSLTLTIGGQKFDHKAYHFVLTYSNWDRALRRRDRSWKPASPGPRPWRTPTCSNIWPPRPATWSGAWRGIGGRFRVDHGGVGAGPGLLPSQVGSCARSDP